MTRSCTVAVRNRVTVFEPALHAGCSPRAADCRPL
jgi:hypothetical protein